MNAAGTMRGPLRRRDAGAQRDAAFGPNMTPMVDVVLVLLVFFMAGATLFGREYLLPTQLDQDTPGASAAALDRLPEARLTVRVRRTPAGPRVDAFGREGLTLGSFRGVARETSRSVAGGNVIVVVVPDEDVRYDDVVTVYDACVGVGLERVRLRSNAN